jgi:hypothetical protein
MGLRRWWSSTSALTRSVLLGICGASIGLALVLVSVAVDQDVVKAVLSNLGTAVFTAAVISVLYEGFVREGLLDDVRKRVGMSEKVVAQGLTQLGAGDSIPFFELMQGTKEIIVLPTDPVDWYTRYHPWLHALAKNAEIGIKVYLPRPEIYSRVRKGIMGPEGDGTLVSPEHCTKKTLEAVAAWRRQIGSHKEGFLEIYQYDSYPHRGLVVSDDCLVILTPSPDAPAQDPDALACVFQGGRASARVNEAKRSIASLPKTVLVERVGSVPEPRRRNPILPVGADSEGLRDAASNS